jgi:pre-mRNA branch site protein p14
LASSDPSGKYHLWSAMEEGILTPSSQVRQGIANNTKGTAFVVYEDVMDAKMACDKLNGFNFQNRYLVGTSSSTYLIPETYLIHGTVLYHQPEKMVRSKEDLEARKENLEQLKKQHGIE